MFSSVSSKESNLFAINVKSSFNRSIIRKNNISNTNNNIFLVLNFGKGSFL